MTDPAQPSLLAPAAADLPRVIEALLFVAEEPLTVGAMVAATGASEGAVRKAIRRLEEEHAARGIHLMADGQRFQLVTAPDCAPYVERLLGAGPGQRLSRAALEVLTIIAYRQPCTRSEIEAIRGVNSDRLVATLEARGLVAATGTADSPGRPRLYRTTMRFLEHFGIRSPDELPPLPSLEAPEPAQPF